MDLELLSAGISRYINNKRFLRFATKMLFLFPRFSLWAVGTRFWTDVAISIPSRGLQMGNLHSWIQDSSNALHTTFTRPSA
jgi:hypothetical protein